MHYILFYEVVDDYIAKRAPFREEHLALARASYARREMVMAGALAEPVDGALLVFRDPASAEAFAKADPYVKNGLVTSWKVRKWNTVIGEGASTPAGNSELPS